MAAITDINLSISGSLFLLIILLILFGVSAFWFYRNTIPPVSKRIRLLLTILRMVVFFLIFLLLFRPMLHLKRRKNQSAKIAVLLDASASMQIKDQGSSRAEILKTIITSSSFKKLKNDYDLHFFSFSDLLHPLTSIQIDSLMFLDSGSDFGGALSSLAHFEGELPADAVLFISDGVHNLGENPLRTIQTFMKPVYSIAIGRETVKKDLMISRVLSNEVTYVDNRVSVDVSIRGPGYAGRRINLTLKEGSLLTDKWINVPSQGRESIQRLYFTPKTPGYHRIVVSVDPLEDELTLLNNQFEIFIKVIESKMRVFVISGSPSPDVAFLKRFLESDEDVEVLFRTEKKGGGFYEGTILTENDLSKQDVFILLDYPTQKSEQLLWNRIKIFLQNEKKPFWVIAGKAIDFNKWEEFSYLLPILSPVKLFERLIVPHFAEQGQGHPLLRIKETWEENKQLWERLPPFFVNWQFRGLQGGGEILLHGIPANAVGRSDIEDSPILFVRQFEKEKSILLLGNCIYRWNLLTQGIGDQPEIAEGFISNALRWLAVREQQKTVRLSVEKLVSRAGEEMTFTAQIMDGMLRPINDAQVQLRVQTPTEEQFFNLPHSREGRHQGEHRFFDKGQYQAIASASLEGRLLGQDTLSFSVSPFNPEFLENRANPTLLFQLSAESGGKSGPPDSLEAVFNAINFPQHVITRSDEIELFQLPAILVCIILMLGLEWFIRKRKGMV